MAFCPKHQVALKTWPSGDQYCPNLDPTGREAKNGKRYCTYVLKAGAAEDGRAAETVKATPAVQSARIANQDARVRSVLDFSGRIFQGQGAAAAADAIELARLALGLYE